MFKIARAHAQIFSQSKHFAPPAFQLNCFAKQHNNTDFEYLSMTANLVLRMTTMDDQSESES